LGRDGDDSGTPVGGNGSAIARVFYTKGINFPSAYCASTPFLL
jgi:hypothetical protein